MNIRKLNEELDKFLQLDEVSDKLANKVSNERKDKLNRAKNNFANGSGSIDTLKSAKQKKERNDSLMAARAARKKANIKHTYCEVDDLGWEWDLNTIFKCDYALGGLSDDDLIRLANSKAGLDDEVDVATTTDEAWNIIGDGLTSCAYHSYVYPNGTCCFNANKKHYGFVLKDKTPEQVQEEIDKAEKAEDTHIEKLAKKLQPKNLVKLMNKGEMKILNDPIEDERYEVEYKFKNTLGIKYDDIDAVCIKFIELYGTGVCEAFNNYIFGVNGEEDSHEDELTLKPTTKDLDMYMQINIDQGDFISIEIQDDYIFIRDIWFTEEEI